MNASLRRSLGVVLLVVLALGAVRGASANIKPVVTHLDHEPDGTVDMPDHGLHLHWELDGACNPPITWD